jgi:two-component SAPR family response regulator
MLENIFIKNDFEAKITFTSDDADEILEYVCLNKTDVVILDINLKSNKSGLELAEAIREKNNNVYIIFTTAHLEFAMVAYKFKTFDYIAKPITQDRLEETIKRLFNDVYSQPKKFLKIDKWDMPGPYSL